MNRSQPQQKAKAYAERGSEFKGTGAIWLSFPYSEYHTSVIRMIPGAVWIAVIRTWKIPRNKSAARKIIFLFPDADINDEFKRLL